MTDHLTLDPEAVEAIARRVVALMREESNVPSPRYVDAATLARELSVERDWVYSHAEELGAIRLGGPSGRIRFDLQEIEQRLGACQAQPARRFRKPPGRQIGSSKYSDGPAVGRRPSRLSNTDGR